MNNEKISWLDPVLVHFMSSSIVKKKEGTIKFVIMYGNK